jgi:transposase-like protein
MTKRTRRKITAAPKAAIALEALREQAAGSGPAQRYEVHLNKIHASFRSLPALSFELFCELSELTSAQNSKQRVQLEVIWLPAR